MTAPRSVLTDRSLAEIAAAEGGNIEKAATGDPPEVGSTKKRVRSARKPG